MGKYDEEYEHHMLDQGSEYGGSQETLEPEQALRLPARSWSRTNILSLAILLVLLYVAILETMNTAVGLHRGPCSGFSDNKPSKLSTLINTLINFKQLFQTKLHK